MFKLINSEEYKNFKNRRTAKNLLSISLFNEHSDPLSLYKKGVQYTKEARGDNTVTIVKIKRLKLAIDFFSKSLDIYKNRKDTELQQVNCYSALGACYRDIENYNLASLQFEKAIEICYIKDKKELGNVIEKYNKCLSLAKENPDILYQQAIESFKNQQFFIALTKLLFVLNCFKIKQSFPEKIATCHSTIASCYRNLGELNEAQTHCNEAISIYHLNGITSKDLEIVTDKLNKIKNLMNILIKSQI